MSIRTINATRYVTPLREGGSLPAIIEADDDGMYVLKFRGAGQGPKALIAELIGGEVARALGLPVPEIVFVDLDPELARTEGDPEIQDLIKASAGLNLALDYLPGSITFDPLVDKPDSGLASSVVWLDALISNVDRTPRNPNILTWHKKLWLIDHGASLYFHHASSHFVSRARRPFPQIKDHVLLPFAAQLNEVDEELGSRLSPEVLSRIVDLIPESWLSTEGVSAEPSAQRHAYTEYLTSRLQAPREFVKEAWDAR
jgi:hypothetical protein